MDEQRMEPGFSERLLREIIATPALKEVILLQMKGIKPEAASGLVKNLLWGDPGISMSLFGSLSDVVNWLVEFLLELGRQLNGIPEPLLKDLLGRIGAGIDLERMKQFPEVYGEFLRRLLLDEEKGPDEVRAAVVSALNRAISALDQATLPLERNREEIARALRQALKELDTAALARSARRLGNLAASSFRAERREKKGKGAAGALKAASGVLGAIIALRLVKKVLVKMKKR